MNRKIDQPTEWVNSMVVVEKPSGGLRICLDPRDLNKSKRSWMRTKDTGRYRLTKKASY